MEERGKMQNMVDQMKEMLGSRSRLKLQKSTMKRKAVQQTRSPFLSKVSLLVKLSIILFTEAKNCDAIRTGERVQRDSQAIASPATVERHGRAGADVRVESRRSR